MATSSELFDPTNHDHILRPRPRKPVHSQLSVLSAELGAEGGDGAHPGLESITSAHTSGRSTPIPTDALPSLKVLSSARKTARAEQRQRQRKHRLFPTVDFESRVSHFDPQSDYRDFHGFFNLFWIGLAIMAITSMLRNIKDTGYPMRFQIWQLFTVKLWHLALADLVMVASAGVVTVVLQMVVRRSVTSKGKGLSWAGGGMAIQSVFQTIWLALWVAIPFLQEWTWTAQVFLLLHTMVVLMKMHSYAFYNGHLSETEKRLVALDHPSTASKAPAYIYPTPDNPDGEIPDPARGDTNANGNGKHGDSVVVNGENEDDEVVQLREDLARELTSPMGNITYPANLTWGNYVDFLFCPTLCYEIEYPRTEKIDWTNLIGKTTAVFGCIFLLTIISEEFILPILQASSLRLAPQQLVSLDNTTAHATAIAAAGAGAASSSSSSSSSSTTLSPISPSETLLILAETVSWLLFPFMLIFLLVFLVIFEYVLGAFAELTHFADRHFYSDWWNSTDWMEFSREWNVPVHSFLRRHVYGASRARLGKGAATVITFLVSAVGHEIIMACISKKVRGYGFVAQMLQLPIVMLQQTRWVKGKETLNNVCFWCSMIMGLSMICSLYVLV